MRKAPLCKGSSAEGGEGLFLTTLPPLRGPPPLTQGRRNPNSSRRGLQVCFAYLQIPPTAARFPNPSRRRLQVCFAHSQIPYTGEALIQPSPVREGGSRRLTDEVLQAVCRNTLPKRQLDCSPTAIAVPPLSQERANYTR